MTVVSNAAVVTSACPKTMMSLSSTSFPQKKTTKAKFLIKNLRTFVVSRFHL